jgi:hypothetical protein
LRAVELALGKERPNLLLQPLGTLLPLCGFFEKEARTPRDEKRSSPPLCQCKAAEVVGVVTPESGLRTQDPGDDNLERLVFQILQSKDFQGLRAS